MKILSWNINGLRAVYKKGFLEWLKKNKPEILCLQETKAQEEKLPAVLINPFGYFSYFNPALRPGYAGTAVYTREKPLKIETKIGFKRFDEEGRLIRLDYQDFTLINLYLVHGGRAKENLDYKLRVYQKLFEYLEAVKKEKVILLGDFNIAHQEIDLARPQENQNNIMFTPKEKKQIDQLLGLGFIDSFRMFNQRGGHYTWWPYYRQAKERNLGWRIDYVFVSDNLQKQLKQVFILPEVMFGSDHCPVGVEIF